MRRFIAALATLTLVVTPITVWLAPAHDARACTVIADTLDGAVAHADVIALVQASEVGGPENAAPILTPTATPSPTPTVAAFARPRCARKPGAPQPRPPNSH